MRHEMQTSMLYLGVVTYVGQRGQLPVASLRPLLVADEGETRWERELGDGSRKELFPNTGCVSWIHPDSHAETGTLWEFKVQEQRSYVEEEPRHDRYMVSESSSRQVYEVLDVDLLKEQGQCAREMLTSTGIRIDANGTRRFWIRVEDNLWMLTDLVQKDGDEGRWVIPLDESGITRWQEWDLQGPLSSLKLDGERLLLAPKARPSGPPHQRDWSSDIMVLRRVMQQLRRYDRDFTDALELTSKAVDRFAELLSSSTSLNEPDLEEARIERVKALLERLGGSSDSREAVLAILADSPITDELEQKKNEILEEERDRAREQAGHELSDLLSEIESRRKELSNIEKTIEVRHREQEALVSNFEESLAERARKAMDNPAELLSTVALIRAVRSEKHDQRVVASGATQEIAKADFEATQATVVASQEDALKSIEGLMLRSDVPRSVGRAIHASFLAGAMPIIAGARAYDAFVAYARSITAGEVFWIPVSALWVDPLDYLEGVASQSELKRGRSGLSEFLDGARSDSRMRLVVLDGIERSNVESYLLPLLGCYGDVGRSFKRSFPIASTNGSARTQMDWPENVLLAATTCCSSVSMALPQSLWGYATLCLSDCVGSGSELRPFLDKHPDVRAKELQDIVPQYVERETWQSWRANSREVVLGECVEKWVSLDNDNRLDRAARDLALRFYAADRQLVDVQDALADVAAYCLLPQVASAKDVADRLFDEIVQIYPERQRALDSLSRLVECE